MSKSEKVFCLSSLLKYFSFLCLTVWKKKRWSIEIEIFIDFCLKTRKSIYFFSFRFPEWCRCLNRSDNRRSEKFSQFFSSCSVAEVRFDSSVVVRFRLGRKFCSFRFGSNPFRCDNFLSVDLNSRRKKRFRRTFSRSFVLTRFSSIKRWFCSWRFSFWRKSDASKWIRSWSWSINFSWFFNVCFSWFSSSSDAKSLENVRRRISSTISLRLDFVKPAEEKLFFDFPKEIFFSRPTGFGQHLLTVFQFSTRQAALIFELTDAFG